MRTLTGKPTVTMIGHSFDVTGFQSLKRYGKRR